MVINNLHTTSKSKEPSSSETSSEQVLTLQKKFIRRPDISSEDRLHLAIAGLSPFYREEPIWQLCARYKVSHEFIYSLSRNLHQNKEILFGVPNLDAPSELEKVLQSMRFHIETKLKTQSPLYGLSDLAQSWGLPYHSINFASESLAVAGYLLQPTLSLGRTMTVILLTDEVYSGGQAILVNLDAESMAVLDIKLIDHNLIGQDWVESWLRLKTEQLIPSKVVKDQGKPMRAAEHVLPEDSLILPDSFHAVSKRLGKIYAAFVKQTDDAIKAEWKRKEVLDKADKAPVRTKKAALYEAAQEKTLVAIDRQEWFEEHYFTILQQFRPFTSQGLPRDEKQAAQKVLQALEALSLLEYPRLDKEITYIRKMTQSGQLFLFLTQIPPLYEQLKAMVGADLQWIWALNWQWWKKSMQTHSPKVQRYALAQRQAAKELLQEYYADKGDDYASLEIKVLGLLDNIVQASSLVECFNSILKPFIKSARGQVTQQLLNIVMFHHNYTRFKRGKRKGKAPIEILTGQTLNRSWIDLIMDKVQAAFQAYDTVSLKQLKQYLKKGIQPTVVRKIDAQKSRNKKSKIENTKVAKIA